MRGLDMKSRWNALAAYQHRITDQGLFYHPPLHHDRRKGGDSEALTSGLRVLSVGC